MCTAPKWPTASQSRQPYYLVGKKRGSFDLGWEETRGGKGTIKAALRKRRKMISRTAYIIPEGRKKSCKNLLDGCRGIGILHWCSQLISGEVGRWEDSSSIHWHWQKTQWGTSHKDPYWKLGGSSTFLSFSAPQLSSRLDETWVVETGSCIIQILPLRVECSTRPLVKLVEGWLFQNLC